MENDSLDSQEVEKHGSLNPMVFIAMGVFLYLTLSALDYLVINIAKDGLIILNVPPVVNFWSAHVICLLVIIIGTYLIARKIVVFDFNKRGIPILVFKYIIVAFVVTWGLQYLYYGLVFDMFMERYSESFYSYNDAVEEHFYLWGVGFTFDILKYIVIGGIILNTKRRA